MPLAEETSIDLGRPSSLASIMEALFFAMSRKLIGASYRGLGDLPIFRRAGGDIESLFGSQPKPVGRQAGRAGGWSRVLVCLGVDQSEANHGSHGHAHALPVGRVCHRCQVSKSAECQFEFCQIDSRNLSGVSDLLIIAQSPFYRRIAATPKGSEESGKIGPHAWTPGTPGSHGPLSSNGPLRGFFCSGLSGVFGASGTMAGPNHVTVGPC